MLIKDGDAKGLRDALTKFVTASKAGGKLDPSKAPPIKLFDDLMCLDQIAESTASFEACTSQEELKAVWAEVNGKFARVRELLASVKSANVDLQNAEKARRRTGKVGTTGEAIQKRELADSIATQLKVRGVGRLFGFLATPAPACCFFAVRFQTSLVLRRSVLRP